VNVVPDGDQIQIELSSSAAVTPHVSKLGSPARILIEMPDTVMAGAQSKIAVGRAGVKGVRIGMDGKTPPSTSVVVDLDKALAYEVTPAANGKVVLTLHTDGAAPSVAKSAPLPAKVPVTKAVVAKAEPVKTPVKTAPAKAQAASVSAAKPAVAKAVAAKPIPAKPAVAKTVVAANQPPAKLEPKTEPFTPKLDVKKADVAKADEKKGEDKKAEDAKADDKKWAMNGKRDPFFSPVVQQGGSGCSTGKKCLDIGNINLRGVVKSDTGFIAVVTNNMNKAYFLRENDPVFNGYVMKITGDSVTFQETVQDKLGKSFTREIVKRIFTPAV
ncbi:MAG: AMIN domain-containing protein, partial [Candidatus Sulfotelmatobacter sp.]